MSLNHPVTDWRGQRVWVIGASSGIGRALAEALLQRGARVALSARRAAELDEIARQHGDMALALPLDVTRDEDWDRAHALLQSAWSGCDRVVFCAADYVPMRAWTLDRSAAARLVDINLTGTLRGVATVLPAMLQQGHGGIAIVASVAGHAGLPRALVYGPTKAALINFAEALYLDLKPRGLDVCIINPGFVSTRLTAGNDFEMPALMTPAKAASEILRGMARGDFDIHFPHRFTRPLRLLRYLPDRFRLALLARVAEKS